MSIKEQWLTLLWGPSSEVLPHLKYLLLAGAGLTLAAIRLWWFWRHGT